jgi:DNA-binding NarL/FixJ family response regulator
MGKKCGYFSYLDKSLNVLIVDDDWTILDVLKETLSPIHLYNIMTANTTKAANGIISSEKRIHVCIMDLGLNDVDHDEYYLLKNFAPYVSFLVHTGSVDPAQGFKSKKYGAKHLITKGSITAIEGIDLVQAINRQALYNLINPSYSETVFDTLNYATEVLFKQSPDSVTLWASEAKITDRELRNLWKIKIGIMARQALTIYNLYSMAFSCAERCFINKCPEGKCAIFNNAKCEALTNYFHTHQKTIAPLLERSIIPSFSHSAWPAVPGPEDEEA